MSPQWVKCFFFLLVYTIQTYTLYTIFFVYIYFEPAARLENYRRMKNYAGRVWACDESLGVEDKKKNIKEQSGRPGPDWKHNKGVKNIIYTFAQYIRRMMSLGRILKIIMYVCIFEKERWCTKKRWQELHADACFPRKWMYIRWRADAAYYMIFMFYLYRRDFSDDEPMCHHLVTHWLRLR